jgi:hypothetical protein
MPFYNPQPSGQAVTIQAGGVTLTSAVNSINFTGAGQTTTNSGNAVTVSITSGGASSIAVGSTVITGGTNGYVLYDNNGVLGELLVSGTGTVTSVASADSSITVTNPNTSVDLAVVKAPKLSTARAINGVNFDGTAPITITAAAGTLTGTTLNSTVVTATIGTLTNLTVAGFVQTTSGGVLSSAALTSGQITTALGFTPGTGTVTSVTSATGEITVATTTTTPVLTIVSAPKLTTARTINGTSFDGSANITVTTAAGTLTGTALNSTVVTSSLTAVGTIATGVWNGTAIADTYISSATNWNTAYTNRITSLTVTGSSGAATLSSNTLNIPTYTLAGLGGISLTSLSSTATGLTYTNTTGVFSLTSGYVIPTTTQATNWTSAYTNQITSLTTTGSSGAATLIAGVLNIPQYAGGGSMVYPSGSGIPIVVSGTSWGTTVAAPAGTILGTTDTQTVTNKDLTSGTNTFPTFNQNTTGSAAKWTTARNLAGNSVDGSGNVAFANKFIVQGTTDAGLSAAQFLGALGTGIVKNTTTTGVLSIATSGTDYSAGTSALATGILKSTTSTGALTIAVAADFPTLNQSTTGNAATATALATGRTISITGDLAYTSPSFDGSGNVTAAGTLATVNSNVGSFTYASITVNAKGLITAASNGTAPLSNPMTTLGDIIYENATPAPARLAGNITSTKNFLVQTGTGSVSTAPVWGTIASGDVPTLNQNTTGSAATLTTPRAINGVNFDGSAGITVTAAAGTLTGTTLNSTVVTSSLTSVGTIATGTWNGTLIAGTYGGTGVNNGAKTFTYLKNMSFTAADDTGVYTLPTGTKTLVDTTVTTLSSLVSHGTITTGGLGTGAVIGGVTMTLGSDATGDIYYRNSSGVLTRLGIGTSGQALTTSAGLLPVWTTLGGGSGTVTSVAWTTSQGVSASVANSTTTPNITVTLGALTGVTSFNGLIVTANTGVITTGTWNGTTIAVANGGTGVTSVTTAPTASAFAGWDANSNLSANNLIDGFTTTATAAGTTTMTIASAGQQYWTGTTTQTVKLPTTSVVAGGQYTICNQSTGNVTVQSSGANTIIILGAGQSAVFTSLTATPTTAANWSYALTDCVGINNATTASSNAYTILLAYKTNTVTNNSAATLTITLPTAGAVDGMMRTVRIFPSSAVAQTLTLVNTENSTVTPPATTGASTTIPIQLGFIFNGVTSKWTVIASA